MATFKLSSFTVCEETNLLLNALERLDQAFSCVWDYYYMVDGKDNEDKVIADMEPFATAMELVQNKVKGILKESVSESLKCIIDREI